MMELKKSWKDILLKNPTPPSPIRSSGSLQSAGDIWNGFKVTKDGAFIITTKYTRNNDNVQGENYELNLCYSIIAITYTKIYPARTWKTETLDEILSDGNKLYKTTIRKRPNHESGIFNFEKQFTVKDFDVTIDAQTHLITDQQDLAIFLRKFLAGVIIYQNQVYAIWKDEEDAFYFFNPSYKSETNMNYKKEISCALFRSIVFSGVLKIFNNSLKVIDEDEIKLIYIDVLKIEKDLGILKSHLVTEGNRALPETDSAIELRSLTDTLSRLDRLISAENRLLNEIEGKSSQPTAFKRPPPVREVFDTKRQEFISPIKSKKETTLLHFINIAADKGILRGTKHVYNFSNGANLIYPANILAILMLRIKNCSSWGDSIMDEILDTAFEVYTNNTKNENIKSPDLTRIKIRDRNFEINPMEAAVVGQLDSKDDTILDLHTALVDFFAKNDVGIIQGPTSVAIWHEVDLYYMYDSAECDKNGNRIVRMHDSSDKSTEKININIANNVANNDNMTGVACLTFFKSIKDLAKAYRNNVAPEKRRSGFVIYTIEFLDQRDVLTAWHNFKGIAKDTWLLRGSINQSSSRFSDETRNHQSSCNAAVAIAFSKIYDPKDWTKHNVNEILLYGDELCKKCLLDSARDEIKPVDLPTEFPIKNIQVSLDIEEAISGLISPVERFVDLKEGIRDFFLIDHAGILTIRAISLALWNDNEEAYYYFDSFSRDERGRQKEGGTSCVMRSLDMDNLINVIESNIHPGRSNTYSISRVRIKLWPMPENPPGNIPPENFVKIESKTISKYAILRNTIHEGHPRFESRRNRQTICNLAQAMAVSTLIPTSNWDATTLNNILIDGDNFFDDLLSTRGEGSDNFEVVVDDFQYPVKFGSNFIEPILSPKLETVYLTEENLKGDVLDATGSLRQILESFFDGIEERDGGGRKYAFLISDPYKSALWNEGNNIFMFDPKACDDMGTPSMKRLEDANERYKAQSKNVKSNNILETSSSTNDEEDDQYSACVLWFDSVLYLLMKILTNVPVQCVEQKVYIIPVKFRNNLKLTNPSLAPSGKRSEILKEWNEFKEIEPAVYAIRANISQNNELFQEIPNRDNQDVPNSVSAIVFANCHSCSQWDSDILDVILKFGDRLYSSTYDKRKYNDEYKSGPWKHKINSKHIAKKLVISDYKITLNLHDEVIKGDIKATDNIPGVLSLSKALAKFFDKMGGFYVVITCKYYSAAMWMDSEGFFFLFDPHECGPSGKYQARGTACCLRSKKLQKLTDIFTKSVLNYVNYKGIDISNAFTLHGLNVQADKIDNKSKRNDDGRSVNDSNRSFFKMSMPRRFHVPNREQDESVIKNIHTGVSFVEDPEGPQETSNIYDNSREKNKALGEDHQKLTEPEILFLVDANNRQTINKDITLHKQERNRVWSAITDKGSQDSLMTKINKGDTIYSENLETISPPEFFVELLNEDLATTDLPKVDSTIDHYINRSILKPLIIPSQISILETIPEEVQYNAEMLRAELSISKGKSIISDILDELPIEYASKGSKDDLVSAQTSKISNTSSKKSYFTDLHLATISTKGPLVQCPSLQTVNKELPITELCRSESSDKYVTQRSNVKELVVTTLKSPSLQIIEEEVELPIGVFCYDDQNTSSAKSCNKTKDANEPISKYITKATQVSNKRLTVMEKNLARKIGRGFSVLRGNTSLTSPAQEFFQPVPQVLVAVSLAYLKDSSTWTPADLDEINILGNDLLKQSLKKLKEPFDPVKERLHVTKVITDFTIRDQTVRVDIKGAFVRGRMDVNLHEKLHVFFQNHNSGILNTAILVLGIWKFKNVFYLFNCFPCDGIGNLELEGMNCLMSFEKLDSLHDSVMSNLQMEEKEYAFSIRPMSVKITELSNVEVVQSENEPVTLNLMMYVKSIYRMPPKNNVWNSNACTRSFGFVPYCEGGEILRTSTSHLAYEHQILPICIAAVVIAISKKIDRWNETTLNKVIITARKLYREWVEFFDERNEDDVPTNSSLKSCRLEGKTIDVQVKSSIEEGYLFLEELLRAFEDFFHKEQTGIFCAGDKFVIMKRYQRYYCFDAVSGCNPYVMRFDNLKHLTIFVYAKCLKNSEPGATLRRFNIASVRISECV